MKALSLCENYEIVAALEETKLQPVGVSDADRKRAAI
jgi:hypothetical protein